MHEQQPLEAPGAIEQRRSPGLQDGQSLAVWQLLPPGPQLATQQPFWSHVLGDPQLLSVAQTTTLLLMRADCIWPLADEGKQHWDTHVVSAGQPTKHWIVANGQAGSPVKESAMSLVA